MFGHLLRCNKNHNHFVLSPKIILNIATVNILGCHNNTNALHGISTPNTSMKGQQKMAFVLSFQIKQYNYRRITEEIIWLISIPFF